MKISTKIAATVIALCSAATAAAAPATIRSSIDSTTMTMGNKTMIRVAVVKDKSQAGHLIAPQDSIVNEVEVAGEISHSVADLGNGRVQETYVIPVQAFLPGPYVLPGMKYVLEGDTLVGDEMPLKVLDVDTRELEKKGLYDYKTVANPDKKFWDFIPDFGEFFRKNPWIWWVLGGLALLAAAALGVIMYQRKKAGKPILPFIPQKRLLPPYEEAMEAIAALRKSNLAAHGDIKGYYTRLSDIVRRYIWRRYEIGAMEMTSAQILSAVNRHNSIKETDGLSFLLETADFVKFAKMAPSTDENERSMQAAEAFIENNKPVEPSPEEASKNKKEK